jgi:hypothetical protein
VANYRPQGAQEEELERGTPGAVQEFEVRDLAWFGKTDIYRAMEPKSSNDPRRDELLASYEDGVWTFIAVVGCALVGVIIWVGFVIL